MPGIKPRKTKAVTEFGDFQTPPELALAATRILNGAGVRPKSILEPTCGRGAFIAAAAECFPEVKSIVGIDINRDHLAAAEAAIGKTDGCRIALRQGDFFKIDWKTVVASAEGPWLILGNPPWVTSSDLGAIESDNLPKKSNFQGRRGIEAVTGKSNFDISEWMLLRYLDLLEGSDGIVAVLCKTAVARKILLHIWKKKYPLRAARMYQIDALLHFRAAVDACFLILETQPRAQALSCDIFDAIDAKTSSHAIGFSGGHVISNMTAFNRHRNILGPEDRYVWRSGVKHDCSKIMELTALRDGYLNGLGEMVDIEDDLLFPMLKSSDIGNGRACHRRAMVVTQQFVGQDTNYIRSSAPKTWEYLNRYSALLHKRGSAIYKNKPAFSIFGVGPYSFAPWKVAISGFYKKLKFVRIAPVNGRPMVFDDTIYFLPCWSEEEASFLGELLRSEAAHEFFDSMIYWNDKRPITVDVLKRLSIRKLAAALGLERDYARFTAAPTEQLLPGL